VWAASGGHVEATVGRATFFPNGPGDASVVVEAGKIGEKHGVQAGVTLMVAAPLPGGVTAGGPPTVPTRTGETKNPPPNEMDGPPPVIDAVELEKKEVCRGEFNVVKVKAHDPRGADFDPYLNYNIDGYQGQSVPLFYRGSGKHGAERFVTVYGRGNRTWVRAPIPEVKFKDCEVKRIARMVYGLVPNTEDNFQFRVKVESAPDAPAFVPVSYAWDFGDGSSDTTGEPSATHSFLHRKQDRANSNFVVSARIRGKNGEEVVAREALTLMNMSFVMRDPEGKHYVQLIVEMNPRYPVREGDDSIHQTAHIWHNDDKPVRINSIEAQDYTKQGDRLENNPVDPLGFLGTADLPPAGVTVNLKLSKDEQDYIAYRTWFITGTAADGTPVHGAMSLMVPGKIERGKSDRVSDPAMKDRIVTAMKLLGKKPGDTISDEDMLRLEQQGLLPPYTPPDEQSRQPDKNPGANHFFYPPAGNREQSTPSASGSSSGGSSDKK
jgi:hypothetical protein